MISQTMEYALRAMAHLATQWEQDPAPQTTRHIAAVTHVPADYLSKIVSDLVRAGVVEAHRGPGGGVQLARSPHEITMYEVAQAVDPLTRVTACPLHLPQHSEQLCPLHQRLDRVFAAEEKAFRETTIYEVIGHSSPGICCGPELEPQHNQDAADSHGH